MIGVASDTRSERFSILDGPRLYTLRDAQSLDGQLFVRFSGSAAPVSASIERIIKSLDATQESTPSTVWDFLREGHRHAVAGQNHSLYVRYRRSPRHHRRL